ncbi:hypothetical protein HDU79_001724 [Rhizoclosmatium sp. JEL0117]|nr:hypothetical protein HDU79_001724 [Rhizoclosmatium sp. JEL0117]
MVSNPTTSVTAVLSCPPLKKAIETHDKHNLKDLIGNVVFQTSLNEAVANNSEGTPIFLQFQELPGCHTCTNYAANVLAHPLMAEFISTFFIPVLVNNNPAYFTTEDSDTLARFNEPHENNPTSRVLSPDGNTVVASSGDVWTLTGIFEYLVRALVELGAGKELSGKRWIDALATSAGWRFVKDSAGFVVGLSDLEGEVETATFFMECYWGGEALFGDVFGIISTFPGWLDGVEVVEVQFDTVKTGFPELLEKVLERDGFGVFVHNEVQAKFVKESGVAETLMKDRRDEKGMLKEIQWISKRTEVKYHLRNKEGGALGRLPLTTAQQVWVNAALSDRAEIAIIQSLLSPKQIDLWTQLVDGDMDDIAFGPDADSGLAEHLDLLETKLNLK